MEWHEDPNRARNEIRKACWRGAWRMLGIQMAVLIPAAILFPVFAQTKGGPKLDNSGAVARAIDIAHRETGRWPATFDELRPRLQFRHRHGIAFIKLADHGSEAEYVVAVDQRLVAYRIGGGVKSLRDRIASGIVDAGPNDAVRMR